MLALKAIPARPDLRVSKASGGRRVKLVLQEWMGKMEWMVHKDLKDLKDLQAKMAKTVHRGLKDLKDLQVRMVKTSRHQDLPVKRAVMSLSRESVLKELAAMTSFAEMTEGISSAEKKAMIRSLVKTEMTG